MVNRTRLILVAVLIIALGIRIAYVVTDARNPLGGGPRDADIAHNIIDHGRWFYFSEPATTYLGNSMISLDQPIDTHSAEFEALDKGPQSLEVAEPVGSAVVMAAVWEVTGSERYLPMEILQAILDALAVLLVYRIAMLLFGRTRAAVLAAALYAVYFPIAWQAIIIYSDVWAIDFTIVIVAAYLEARNSVAHRRSWLIVCGLLTGLGAYFRPAVLILPLAIALAMVMQVGWRVALRWGLSVTAIAAVLLVPWTIRNYEDFHAFIPTRSSFWENMWYGLGERPNDFGATEDTGGKLRAEIARVRPDLRFESPAWDAFIKPRVVKALEDHPLYYFELLARRTAQATVLVYAPEWMRRGVISPVGYRGGPLAFIVQRPLVLLEDAFQPVIFLLAMLALAGTWRRSKQEHAILIAVALSVLVPYIMIHVFERYILPVAFVYCVWIGYGVDLLVEHITSRDRLASIERPELARR